MFPSPLSIAHLVVSDWLFTLASGRARQRQTVRQTHTNCRSKENNLAPWWEECYIHTWLTEAIAFCNNMPLYNANHTAWLTILQRKMNPCTLTVFTVPAQGHKTPCTWNTENTSVRLTSHFTQGCHATTEVSRVPSQPQERLTRSYSTCIFQHGGRNYHGKLLLPGQPSDRVSGSR